MKTWICVLFLCSFYSKSVFGNLEYDAPQEIHLYHNLEPSIQPKWLECGLVTLQNINTGHVIFVQPPLTSRSLEKLDALADGNLFYRIKAVVKTSKGKESIFYTFTNADVFVHGGLSMVLNVFLDTSGSIIGVTSIPTPNTEPHEKRPVINSSFSFKATEQGPVPDTATYIQKLEREREAKQGGTVQDNRSFLAKYWMYLVPIALFAVLSGTTNAEGGQSAR